MELKLKNPKKKTFATMWDTNELFVYYILV